MLGSLRDTLTNITSRDPEQEVRGIALPVLEAVLQGVRNLMPGDAIAPTVRDVISPEAIAEGEPPRAVDVLLVLDSLLGADPGSLFGSGQGRTE